MFTNVHRRSAPYAAAALAGWLVCAGAPAKAADVQPNANMVLRSVSVAGLDLASANGAAMLHHRIDVAALKACQEATNGDGLGSPGFAECYAHASIEAWQQAQVRIAAARDGAALASAGRQ